MNETRSRRAAFVLRIRRYRSWRALREWAFSEAARAGPEAPVDRVHLVVPGRNAAWTMQRAWRSHMERMDRTGSPARGSSGRARTPGGPEPLIGPAAGVFRDLAGLLPRPVAEASPLARELVMSEALCRHAGQTGAPPGDPEAFARPFLAFLDEQAGDFGIDPGRAAFDTFCDRAKTRFAETAEVDAGAARLLALTGWLARVHATYRAALAAAEQVDPDGARRKLLAGAPGLRAGFRKTLVLALGENAMRPAECQLALALLPPGNLVWALPDGVDPPVLPAGIAVRDDEPPVPAPASSRPVGPPSLFRQPDPPLRPTVYVPEGASGNSASHLFRAATDREQEPEIAAGLLARLANEAGPGFFGWERCAIVARNPRNYLEAATAAFRDYGIGVATPHDPPLSEQPRVAAVADVLDFAARPGRLSRAFRLMRSPFFADPELPEDPRRGADRLAAGAGRLYLRNSRDAADLPSVARAFAGEAERRRGVAAWLADQGRSPDRQRELAEEMDNLAKAAARIAVWAEELRPLRDGDASLATAVEALRTFLSRRLSARPDPAGEGLVEAVDHVLEQTQAMAPEGALVRSASSCARRLRRILGARRSPRGGDSAPGPVAVHLVAAADAPYGDYDILVVLGLVDGEWPAPRPGNIFFPDHVLEEATRNRNRRFRNREAALLRSLVDLPKQGVAFFRPQRIDGFPAAASALDAELTGAMAVAKARTQTVRPESREAPVRAVAAAPLAAALDRRAPSLRSLLDRPLSPSAIDGYRRNPAQFFADRGLGLGEERDLADVMSATERGERLHAFLKWVYGRRIGQPTPHDEAGVKGWCAELRRKFRWFAGKNLDPVDARTEEKWLFGTGFSPGALEWFLREEAGRGPTQPLEVESWIEGRVEPASEEAPALVVRGRLDRLDERPDGKRVVIDYKSGRPFGRPLQTRLYARVHERVHGARTDDALAYFGGRAWDDSTPKAKEKADDAIRAVRDGIAEGRFPAAAKDGAFDAPLVTRSDLPDLPDPPEASPDAEA